MRSEICLHLTLWRFIIFQFVKAALWSTSSTATDVQHAASWSIRHSPFTTSGGSVQSSIFKVFIATDLTFDSTKCGNLSGLTDNSRILFTKWFPSWRNVSKCVHNRIFKVLYVCCVSFCWHFFPLVERDQMCSFYKERGLEVPKAGKIIIIIYQKTPKWCGIYFIGLLFRKMNCTANPQRVGSSLDAVK